MVNLKRFRDPLVAAAGALLIAGTGVVFAASPAPQPSQPLVNAEEPASAPDTDTDTLQEGDQTTLDEGAEDPAGADQQDPNYAGSATTPVDESKLPADEAAEAAALSALAGISQADAESAAKAVVSGTIVKSELDNENGFVVWSVEVRDSAGATHDVKIDAGNGAVLGTGAGDGEGAE